MPVTNTSVTIAPRVVTVAGDVYSSVPFTYLTPQQFGAVGDGTTDDTDAIIAAIAALDAAGGGILYFPEGTYIVAAQASSFCVDILGDNIHLVGAGRGVSIIKLKAGEATFSRVIGASGRTDISIRHLTVDGNAANQTAGYEHQHGIFLDSCIRATVDDVHIKHTRGDNLYWYDGCARCIATNSYFEGTYRVGIHVQVTTDCIIEGCHFWDMDNGAGGVKCELDDEGDGVNGLVVDGCTFEATTAGGIFGVLISGFSATTVSENLTVTGCTFRNLGQAIGLGIYSRGWTISGNLIDGASAGITETSYTTGYAYTGRQDITIVGNTLRAVLGTGADHWGISVANCDRVTIADNTVNCTDSPFGIRVQHCDMVQLTGNNLSIGGSGAYGMSIYRCITIIIGETLMNISGGGTNYGIVASDDVTYPTSHLWVRNLLIVGTVGEGIRLNDLTVANNCAISNVLGPNVTTLVATYDARALFPELERHTFGTKKHTYGTAAPASGTWAVGDIVWNTAPAAGGTIGWVCTTAGTPGTFKTFGGITA